MQVFIFEQVLLSEWNGKSVDARAKNLEQQLTNTTVALRLVQEPTKDIGNVLTKEGAVTDKRHWKRPDERRSGDP
jgi:hypothetical protein